MPPDYEEVKKILLENAEVTDVKRAAAFFKLIRYSYGSGCTSFGCRPFDVRNCFDTIWQASRRLADTVIENKDFEALIRQYAIRLIMRRKVIMQWYSEKRITNGFETL